MCSKVLYEAWKNSAPFKRLVLNEVYIATNLGRPSSISEIQMLEMIMEGNAPQLETIKLCSYQDYCCVGADTDLDCYVEGDLNFEGSITFKIKTGGKVNWPGFAFLEIPITINITVKQFKGRVRLLYSEKS